MSTSIGIALSTFNDGIFRISEICKSKADKIYVLHQVTENAKIKEYQDFYQTIQSDKVEIQMMLDKGLAKSRNYCLQNISTNYAVICDDDITLDEILYEQLLDYAKQYPATVVFTGRMKSDIYTYSKDYADQSFLHSIQSAASVSSCEMIVNTKWIGENNIFFDERFSLGSKFPSGEEFIFLSDIIVQGGEVRFIPLDICTHPHISSGNIYTPEMVMAKGAMIRRVYDWKYPIVNCLFAIKKYRSYKSRFSFMQFIRFMFHGSHQLLKND